MATDTDRIPRDASNTDEEAEIQGAESLENQTVLNTGLLFTNNKRTYDAYQQRDLVQLDRSQQGFDADREQERRHAEALFEDTRVQLAQLHNLSLQALQNAVSNTNNVNVNGSAVYNRENHNASTSDMFADRVTDRHAENSTETSEMTGKRALDAHDIATDYMWSGSDVEQGSAMAIETKAVQLDDASLKAIGAAVAAAVVSALSSNRNP